VHNVSIAINDKQQGASDIRGHFAIALKQGKTYTIRLSKEGYETIENKITFDGPSSLFYVNMVSEKQLLDDAFKALRQKKWAEAKKLLERAQAINPSIGSSYLMAIYYFRTGQKEQSLNLLQSLLEESSENEYVVKLIGYISSTD
jgi:tetratricopeptide (TPR) repeat protein